MRGRTNVLCLVVSTAVVAGCVAVGSPMDATTNFASGAVVLLPEPAPAATGDWKSEVMLRARAGGVLGASADVLAPRIPLPRETAVGALFHSIAIKGEGYFQVELPDGSIGYTRDCVFRIDERGSFATIQGYKFAPHITIPTSAISMNVDSQGCVLVTMAGAFHNQKALGEIILARFPNPQWLAREDGVLKETRRSGSPIISIPCQNGMGEIRDDFHERDTGMSPPVLLELVRELVRDTGKVAGDSGVEGMTQRDR